MVNQVGVEPTFIQLCTHRLEGVANTDSYSIYIYQENQDVWLDSNQRLLLQPLPYN